MGESIFEATIISWHKSSGDRIEEDDILLEIATDKVDSEVPSPVRGIVSELLFSVNDTVKVGEVIAIIEQEGSSIAQEVIRTDQPATEKPKEAQVVKLKAETPPQSPTPLSKTTDETPKKSSLSSSTKSSLTIPQYKSTAYYPSQLDGQWFSPIVRNMARAEGISVEELRQLSTSLNKSRISKDDLLRYIDQKKTAPGPSSATAIVSNHDKSKCSSEKQTEGKPVTAQSSEYTPHAGDKIVPMDRMRTLIAAHMVHSVKTAPHVTSVVEADVTNIVLWRDKAKGLYLEKYGERLTFSPIFAEAVISALKDFPMINAVLDGDNIVLKAAINLGIATALESGNLIVPVIHNAGDLNLYGLTRKVNDLASRARKNQLKPEEIQGGTFTISNIGTFNNIIGTPIIPQPQLAILALGAIQKKPVVEQSDYGDIISIRHMMYLSLSFDHRVIDGYLGGNFLNRIAHYLENFDTNRHL